MQAANPVFSEASFESGELPWALPVPARAWDSEVARQVLVVRQTWRRNLAGHPFLVSASEDAAREALQQVRAMLAAFGYTREGRLAEAPARWLGLCRERLILPWQPVTFAPLKGLKSVIFPAKTWDSAARLGEVDHVQVACWQAGWQAEETLPDLAATLDDPGFPAQGPYRFARHPSYGFLLSDPAWAGAGLQIEAVVHLPALTAHRRLAQVHEGLQALGLMMHPEPMGTYSGQDAGYFRISSRGGLGLTAQALRQKFWQNLKPLLAWESEMRQSWWQRDTLVLRDRIRRSLHMLGEAQLLPLHEAMGFISFVRLGALLGEVEPGWLVPAEKVRVLTQSSHLGFDPHRSDPGDKAERQKAEDARRAEKVRTLWKPLASESA